MEKKYRLAVIILSFIIALAISLNTFMAFANADGRTGCTLKTSINGCNCHSSRNLNTSVTITGPDRVITGSSNTYTLTVIRATKTGAGCDIAALTGILAPISPTIQLSGSELTHIDNIPMTDNRVDFLFSYTAPETPTVDTIFATALATNSNRGVSGDLWNWATNFSVEVIPPPRILHLRALMEGFYNPGTELLIRDTVSVYLRNTFSPYAIEDLAKELLDSIGKADLLFNIATNNTPYYIAVMHRNSIETWSAGGNSFVSNSLTYNFTSSYTKAYGGNQIQIGTKWTIFSGDVNQDGTIDLGDGTMIENDAFNFESGYVVTDVNGDETVDITDQTIADNNSYNFVGKVTP